MRPENFIYFLTVSGFFIGLLFSIFEGLEPGLMFYVTIGVTTIFYMIGLASASFFVKYVDLKVDYDLGTDKKEEYIKKVVLALEKREKYIDEVHSFIEDLEKEFKEKN